MDSSRELTCPLTLGLVGRCHKKALRHKTAECRDDGAKKLKEKICGHLLNHSQRRRKPAATTLPIPLKATQAS